MASSNRTLASVDVNGQKWDRCLTDGVFKTGSFISTKYSPNLTNSIIVVSGVALGFVFSALLFKRKQISPTLLHYI